MAGMLPGVECARRRRCHQGGLVDLQGETGFGRTRRFCLYTSNHDTHLSTNSLMQRNTATANQNFQGCELEGAARVARERLDERLRFQKKSESKSLNGKEGMKTDALFMRLQTEVYGSKKSTSKRFSWGRLGSKASSGEDECAVCLERFRGGETLVHLQCAHRFHSRCLVPWIVKNAHCPCCRTDVMT